MAQARGMKTSLCVAKRMNERSTEEKETQKAGVGKRLVLRLGAGMP